SASRLSKVLVVATVLAMPACGSVNNNARVHVEYRQLANFHVYKLDPSSQSSTSAGSGMFILYRITKITNTGSEAAAFTFSRDAVVLVTSDQTHNGEPSGDNILLGSQLITTLPVAAGQTLTQSGGLGCIIKTALTSDPQSLAHTGALLDPIYQIDTEQPVSMDRQAGNNSTALVIDALPSALQSLCDTN
ncbi:MAG: hypothetical protein ACREKH_20415, partial [Candidatus Rokuibacteriota bacterium]